MHLRLTSLACLLAAPLALHAEKPEKVADNVRFRVLSIGKKPSYDVYVKIAGRYINVDIPTDYIAHSFRTSAEHDIVFFKKRAEAKSETSDESFERIAVCKPDGNSPRQLIFFFPGKKQDEWIARAKADIPGAFAPGTRLVMNLSDTKVKFDFGGTELTLNPISNGLLKPAKTVTSDGMVPLKIFRPNAEQKWIPFIATVWRQETTVRKVVLIYPAPAYEGLSLAVVKDVIEPDDDGKKSGNGAKEN